MRNQGPIFMATKRNTKSTAKTQSTAKAKVKESDVNLKQSEAEEVQAEKEVEKSQAPKKVQAFLRMTWPGLGKVGDVIELPENLAKEYESMGVVDTAPAAIQNATKSK